MHYTGEFEDVVRRMMVHTMFSGHETDMEEVVVAAEEGVTV